MKKIIFQSYLFFLLITILSCQKNDDTKNNKIVITTTIFPLYDFIKIVGGDKVDVELFNSTK